ncbi:MAG TPA: dolichyl-phosphate beta-glucosyltransferase [Longimicrobiales bacterium]|nr:dolichyl-phosphate beta-glucosyltransferase [Longimicrobiales bacterium]
MSEKEPQMSAPESELDARKKMTGYATSVLDPASEHTVDVVIPVLNEAHVLEKSVMSVRAFLAGHMPHRWRVVVVDNGSSDGTDRVARSLVERFDDVAFMHLTERGRGRALRHAWTTSQADVVCYTDVDLSTELAALPNLVNGILFEGYEVGTGSRLLPDSTTTRSFQREFISRTYNFMVRTILRTTFSDAQCGFKAVSRKAVLAVVPHIRDESWFFDTELLTLSEKWGYPIMDLAVRWDEDDDSRVKIVRTAWDDIKGILRVRWYMWTDRLARQRQAAAPGHRTEAYRMASGSQPTGQRT